MKNHLALAGLLAAGALAAQDAPPPTAPASTGPAPAEQVLAIPTPGRFRDFFQPFRTDTAALSPDGKYLAYSLRDGEQLSVVVVATDRLEHVMARVRVGDDSSSTPFLAANQAENTPARIQWLRWVTPTRVALEVNRVFPRDGGNPSGAVIAFDADGKHARLLMEPHDVPLATPPPPIGLPGEANPFAFTRNPNAPIAGTWQASEPVPAAGETSLTSDFGSQGADLAAPTDLTPSFEGSANLAAGGGLQIFDTDPRQPGKIDVTVISAAGSSASRRISAYALDAFTGELALRDYDFVLSSRDALLDREGRIRLTLENSALSSFPFRYAYRGPKGAGRDRAINSDPGLPNFTVSPDNFFGRRAIPLGFDADPNILYYASNAGRDTYGIYSLDLATKQQGHLVMENPAYDLVGAPSSSFSASDALVFDHHTHQLAGVRYDNAMHSTAWVKPELRGLQAYLEKAFAGRSVEIIDWDAAGKRYLVATEGPADAGAFYLFEPEQKKITEFARRAPWIDAAHTHATLPFSFTASDGTKLSGLVTVPSQPHLKPIPMIVLCPTWPWERVRSDFSTEVQALADMGFVVMQLNGRGAWGLGLKQREAITAGYDQVQVEDLAGAVDRLQEVFRINPQRVALLGFGHGGFIALRTLQDHPEKFRCAIALDAPVDLARWLAAQHWEKDDVRATLTQAWLGDKARLAAAPLANHPEAIKKPILMLNYPGIEGALHTPTFIAARKFAAGVEHAGATPQFGELSTDYMRGLPQARAAVFGQIEEFLNLNVYDFNVKLKELKMVEK